MRRLLLIALLSVSVSASAQTFDRFSVHATGGKSNTNWHGQATVQSLNLEMGRSLWSHSELAFVISPMIVRQPRSWFGNTYGDGDENVRAIGSTVLLRRRFREDSPRVSYYLEAGTGPMWAEKRVPAATSRFNFHTVAGAGLVLYPQNRVSMVVGYRFGHMSNAGYAPRNPGLNVSSLVIGTRIRVTR